MQEIKENTMYRHFKGNVYKVLYIAYDAENDINGQMEKMVVYKSNHDGKILVRSYNNFIEKVDKQKYPNATQEYRFEQVN